MGEMSDYYRDQQLNEEFKHFHHIRKPSTKQYIWLSSNGVEYKVEDMTNSHIQNTLRCLEQGRIHFDSGYELNLWINIMKDQCNKRGINSK